MQTLSLISQPLFIEPHKLEALIHTYKQQKKSPYMTLDEIAAYLRVPKSRIYDFVRDKKIPYGRVGKSLVFHKKEIDSWIINPKRSLLKRFGEHTGESYERSQTSRHQTRHSLRDQVSLCLSEDEQEQGISKTIFLATKGGSRT